MSGSVPITINSSTGLISGTPDKTGSYLITVASVDWRNGVPKDTVYRTNRFMVVDPVYEQPVVPDIDSVTLEPNPSYNTFKFCYNLNTEQKISMVLFDCLGRTYNEVVPGMVQPAGYYTTTITPVCHGIYFLKVEIGSKKYFYKLVRL